MKQSMANFQIIPAIQSRCTRFRFGPLSTNQMQPRLDHVIEVEGLNVSEDGMKALVTLASGDMRKALNILQSTSMAHPEVTEDTVYTCTGKNVVCIHLSCLRPCVHSFPGPLKFGAGSAIITLTNFLVHQIEQ